MAGDPGAEVIEELTPREGEIISDKRSYGAFDGTGLDEQLRERGVDEVVITGQHTHICVRHSSYGALIRGYEITIPEDAVCAFEGVSEEDALEYLKAHLRRDHHDRRRARRHTGHRLARLRHCGSGAAPAGEPAPPIPRRWLGWTA